jgi:hypothetical protein
MAGGADAKWANHLGVRRHFAPVGDETVISRQLRQLRERGIFDIWIIAPTKDYRLPGTRWLLPDSSSWGHEALNGRDAWSPTGRTIQVYGDVIFTDAAMDTVCGFDQHVWQAFGRHGPGGVSPWGELFAISFWTEHQASWLRALQQAFALKAKGVIRRAGSWEGYRVLGGAKGAEVGRHRLYSELFTEINDATDDFDTVEEYAALLDVMR